MQPSVVGAGLALIDTVASWFLSEDGYGEFKRRRELATAKRAALDALARHDWDALRVSVAELERMSAKP